MGDAGESGEIGKVIPILGNPPTIAAEVARIRFEQQLIRLEQLADGPPITLLEAKYAAVTALQEARAGMAAPRWRSLVLKFAEKMGMTPQRLYGVLDLLRVEEVRRALQTDPSTWSHQRRRHEEIYPNDGWIGQYLLYTQGNEVPLPWHFWSAIATFGCSCRRNYYIDRGTYKLYLNNYVFLLGPTGEGKSSAINVATKLLRQMNEMIAQRENPITHQVALLPEVLTPERMIDKLKAEPSDWITSGGRSIPVYPDSIGLIAADEVVTLLGKSSWHADKMIQLLTAIYAQDHLDTSTVTRGDVILRNLAVSMLAGSTPEWIRTSVTEDLFNGGFMGRCLFIYRDRSPKNIPFPKPADPVTAYQLSDQLATFAMAPVTEIYLTPSARAFFERWYPTNQLNDFESPWLAGYYRRKQDHLMKVAAILALAGGDGPLVNDARMGEALAVLNAEEKWFPKAFRFVSDAGHAHLFDRVMRIIQKRGEASRTDMLRLLYRQVDAKNLDLMLGTLISAKVVEQFYKEEFYPGAGRRKSMWYRFVKGPDLDAIGPFTPIEPILPEEEP